MRDKAAVNVAERTVLSVAVVSEKGDVYTKSNMLGYYRIIRNHGKVVYSMPMFDYLILVTMILAFLSIFVYAFILVLKNLKYWV